MYTPAIPGINYIFNHTPIRVPLQNIIPFNQRINLLKCWNLNGWVSREKKSNYTHSRWDLMEIWGFFGVADWYCRPTGLSQDEISDEIIRYPWSEASEDFWSQTNHFKIIIQLFFGRASPSENIYRSENLKLKVVQTESQMWAILFTSLWRIVCDTFRCVFTDAVKLLT